MCKFHTTAVFSQERADRCKPTNSDSAGQTTCVIAPIGTQNLGMNEASSRLLQIAIRNMRGEPTKKTRDRSPVLSILRAKRTCVTLLQRRVRGNCTGACGVTNYTRLIGEETTRSRSTLSHGVCLDRVAVRGRTGSRSKRERVAALGARRQNTVN